MLHKDWVYEFRVLVWILVFEDLRFRFGSHGRKLSDVDMSSIATILVPSFDLVYAYGFELSIH